MCARSYGCAEKEPLVALLVLVLVLVLVAVRVRGCHSVPATGVPTVPKIPRGHSELADQLKRATISIPLNIAEGAGKPTAKDRSRFHAIARGSAMECGAVLDILLLQTLAEAQSVNEAKSLLVRLVAMLSKMCR